MTDAKFKLEDILNKQKAPPQILDLVHIKIETEEEYKGVIEKIPDYKIKPERVSLFSFLDKEPFALYFLHSER